MADPVKVAKNMFDEFLSKHDPESRPVAVPDVAVREARAKTAAKGGRARAATLSPKKRRDIAKRAARARWSRKLNSH